MSTTYKFILKLSFQKMIMIWIQIVKKISYWTKTYYFLSHVTNDTKNKMNKYKKSWLLGETCENILSQIRCLLRCGYINFKRMSLR